MAFSPNSKPTFLRGKTFFDFYVCKICRVQKKVTWVASVKNKSLLNLCPNSFQLSAEKRLLVALFQVLTKWVRLRKSSSALSLFIKHFELLNCQVSLFPLYSPSPQKVESINNISHSPETLVKFATLHCRYQIHENPNVLPDPAALHLTWFNIGASQVHCKQLL